MSAPDDAAMFASAPPAMPAAYPVEHWQKIASPIWMDINPSDTLQFRSAREHDDERHICPLQLDVIERAVILSRSEDIEPGDLPPEVLGSAATPPPAASG